MPRCSTAALGLFPLLLGLLWIALVPGEAHAYSCSAPKMTRPLAWSEDGSHLLVFFLGAADESGEWGTNYLAVYSVPEMKVTEVYDRYDAAKRSSLDKLKTVHCEFDGKVKSATDEQTNAIVRSFPVPLRVTPADELRFVSDVDAEVFVLSLRTESGILTLNVTRQSRDASSEPGWAGFFPHPTRSGGVALIANDVSTLKWTDYPEGAKVASVLAEPVPVDEGGLGHHTKDLDLDLRAQRQDWKAFQEPPFHPHREGTAPAAACGQGAGEAASEEDHLIHLWRCPSSIEVRYDYARFLAVRGDKRRARDVLDDLIQSDCVGCKEALLKASADPVFGLPTSAAKSRVTAHELPPQGTPAAPKVVDGGLCGIGHRTKFNPSGTFVLGMVLVAFVLVIRHR
ncbi:MAG: hypothetical protein R3A78_15700 [Polyangiales bacterium]|nr:hypothetical protein [Myxococcales bacterium]